MVAAQDPSAPRVRTVLGPVAPERLGATLMHEHSPTIDWSELFEVPPAPYEPVRDRLLDTAAAHLDRFADSLGEGEGPGAVVEATPLRVGRYPDLLTGLAGRTKVHIIGATGFWTEALAPQHPWAVRLGIAPDGVETMAALFVREITEGMEDPRGGWGESFTDVPAGIIKIGTSTYMAPSERAVHRAAAMASIETGCPITTHTNYGGGREQAELLLGEGVAPAKVIIGHQGYRDDREHDEAHDYHEAIARLGCFVQFDRVDHAEYPVDSQARQIAHLVEAGYADQILVSHDMAPFAAGNFASADKSPADWRQLEPDFTVATTRLRPALAGLGVSADDIRKILVANPARALAF